MFDFVSETLKSFTKKPLREEGARSVAEVSVRSDWTVVVSWTVCDDTADRVFSSVLNAVGERETYSVDLSGAVLAGETAAFYVSSMSSSDGVTLVLPSGYVP